MVDFLGGRLLERKSLAEVLSVICLSNKGISMEEIIRVVGVAQADIMRMMTVFNEYIVVYRGFYVCNNDVFRRIVLEYCFRGDFKNRNRKDLHRRVHEALESTAVSVRRLEEQTYHIFSCGDHFAMKQTLASIGNFLLFFNQMNKFDLFRYWKWLEKHGYDPVVEYNRGVEIFDGYYDPTNDHLFTILLQLCRFFKEFSNFETELTPAFRHPTIQGKTTVSELPIAVAQSPQTTIKKFKKLPNLSKSVGPSNPKDNIFDSSDIFYNKDNELGQTFYDNKLKSKESDQTKLSEFLESIGLYGELKNMEMVRKAPKPTSLIMVKRRYQEILEEWEDGNVKVKEGHERFRQYFLDIIVSRTSFKQVLSKSESASQYYNMMVDINLQISQNVQPAYYYYKRWIWIMFPWITLSNSDNFSTTIQKCYSNVNTYIDTHEEHLYYNHSINIFHHYMNLKPINILTVGSKKKDRNLDEKMATGTLEDHKYSVSTLGKERGLSHSMVIQTSQPKPAILKKYTRLPRHNEMITMSHNIMKIDDYESLPYKKTKPYDQETMKNSSISRFSSNTNRIR